MCGECFVGRNPVFKLGCAAAAGQYICFVFVFARLGLDYGVLGCNCLGASLQSVLVSVSAQAEHTATSASYRAHSVKDAGWPSLGVVVPTVLYVADVEK